MEINAKMSETSLFNVVRKVFSDTRTLIKMAATEVELKEIAVHPSMHKKINYSFQQPSEVKDLLDFVEENGLERDIRELVLSAGLLLPEDRNLGMWFAALINQIQFVEKIRLTRINVAPLVSPDIREFGLNQFDFVDTLDLDHCPRMEEVLAKLLAEPNYMSLLENLKVGFDSWTQPLTASLMCVTARRQSLTALTLNIPVPTSQLHEEILRTVLSQLSNLKHLALGMVECSHHLLVTIADHQTKLESLTLNSVSKAQPSFVTTLFGDSMYHFLETLSFVDSVGIKIDHFRRIDFLLATPSLLHLNLEGTWISETQAHVIELPERTTVALTVDKEYICI